MRASNQQLRANEEQLHNLNYNLKERVKELNCLHEISKIIEKSSISLDEILERIVNLIPPAWLYPEITCARISINSEPFTTPNFPTDRVEKDPRYYC